MYEDKKLKFSFKKKLIFSILPLILLLFIGELFCRIKLYVFHKDTQYLTAPFSKKGHKKEVKEKEEVKQMISEKEVESNKKGVKEVKEKEEVKQMISEKEVESNKKGVVEYQISVSQFQEDEEYKKNPREWKYWHHGLNWYYKIKPGKYLPPEPYNYGYFTVNSLGFRGEEFKPFEKNGQIRIFCIGGSSTAGLESPDEQTWSARLEYHLNKNGEKQYEVINSGFGGYISLNYLNLIRYELINYKPDIFIIYEGNNEFLPYQNFRKRNIGQLAQSAHQLLYYRYSMLYTLIVEKLGVLLQHSPLPVNLYDKNIERDFLNHIKRIIKICKDNNIKLVFVRQILNCDKDLLLQDNLSLQEIKGVQKKNLDAYRVAYAKYSRIYYHNKLMELLKELSLKYRIEFLDFRKEFYDAIVDGKYIFFDYIHLTPGGNDLLAELICKDIAYDKERLSWNQ